jgi:predicted hydrolase (HD superfamily)
MEQKMAVLRLSVVLQRLHDTATDIGESDDNRFDAAQQLAMTLNTHFDLIITGLRQAGGARRP